MSYTYHLGLRHVIREDAPFLNANPVEDAIFGLQEFYDSPHFSVVELFHPNEETNGGTTDSVFACTWEGQSAAGPWFNLPNELREQAEEIFNGVYSAPNLFELPGPSCDVLIPNIPPVHDSPFENQLALIRELVEYPICPHQQVYGRDKVILGSLDAQIATLEQNIGEGIYKEFAEISEHMLTKMKLAQKLNLLFTFHR